MTDKVHIALVVAIAENGAIGRDNGMPWRLSSDMAWFKRVTMGKPVIMGRKTWDTLPRKPLPGRPNLVVTRDGDFEAAGAEVFSSLDAALAHAQTLAVEGGAGEAMVIGGAQIYEQALARATRIYLTEVHAKPEADTYFTFDRAAWREVSRERHGAGEKDSADYSFVVLERK
ncbi:MAG TPA: dihydrofolate reductase [Parvibaculum sp.]|uniref:dihydrofolate reductase n=1 Tax=Parvibaculum sp. TaxID=2024848 RepID=UPI002BCCF36E|nr:dihydrofolate reductase [Parvibaculum sp.]HMM13826.1 dihydrofolate reductase [Parvibaculum sp.]